MNKQLPPLKNYRPQRFRSRGLIWLILGTATIAVCIVVLRPNDSSEPAAFDQREQLKSQSFRIIHTWRTDSLVPAEQEHSFLVWTEGVAITAEVRQVVHEWLQSREQGLSATIDDPARGIEYYVAAGKQDWAWCKVTPRKREDDR